MLPCIIIDFFLNNRPDALIIPILFCYKTLHVSGIFSAHHQEFSTVHSALVSFMQFSDDCFQAESFRGHGSVRCDVPRKNLLHPTLKMSFILIVNTNVTPSAWNMVTVKRKKPYKPTHFYTVLRKYHNS